MRIPVCRAGNLSISTKIACLYQFIYDRSLSNKQEIEDFAAKRCF
jgi:hypothetical protein